VGKHPSAKGTFVIESLCLPRCCLAICSSISPTASSLPWHAGPTDSAASFHRSAGLNPVSSIEVYQADGSSNIDGLVIKYTNGQFDAVGSPDATEVGTLLASVVIPAADTIINLWLWTDGAAVQGILLKTSSGVQLKAQQGRWPSQATAAWSAAAEQLGSGLLLGVSAATTPDSTQALLALSFNFLQKPSGIATAVDMPAINLEAMQFTPVAAIRSSVSLSGGSAQATCPDFTATVTRRTSYSSPSSVQRLQRLVAALGASADSSQQSIRLDATLQWAGDRSLPLGGTRTELWSSQVSRAAARHRSLRRAGDCQVSIIRASTSPPWQHCHAAPPRCTTSAKPQH
jgi:hypothetical protein